MVASDADQMVEGVNGAVVEGSLELEKRLFGKWGVATFVDTGNAFGGPGSNTGVKIGAGVGIRWLSPVGPVRLDMAHPFDDDTDTVIRFHIRIGTDI